MDKRGNQGFSLLLEISEKYVIRDKEQQYKHSIINE